MTTHIMSIAYEPKVEGILDGSICQTIRPVGKKRVRSGDVILFHGWVGKPYRSPWNWRKQVKVCSVTLARIHDKGLDIIDAWKPTKPGADSPIRILHLGSHYDWDSPDMDRIARMDGIDPPTGEELKAVLERFYGPLPADWMEVQIIRW